MSAETEFRAALLAHAPLMALLAGNAARIAQNAIGDGILEPYVVYASVRLPDFHLDNSVGATNVQFTVQCWGATALAAAAVAEEVQAALLEAGVVCTSRATTFEQDLGLDGEELVFDWWE